MTRFMKDSYMNKTALLKSYLQSGASVTTNDVTLMFEIKNPSAAVRQLRTEGVCIYTNKTSGGTAYRIGAPSKALVAAAFASGFKA